MVLVGETLISWCSCSCCWFVDSFTLVSVLMLQRCSSWYVDSLLCFCSGCWFLVVVVVEVTVVAVVDTWIPWRHNVECWWCFVDSLICWYLETLLLLRTKCRSCRYWPLIGYPWLIVGELEAMHLHCEILHPCSRYLSSFHGNAALASWCLHVNHGSEAWCCMRSERGSNTGFTS